MRIKKYWYRKDQIIIPAYDLYSKAVRYDNNNDRVTTLAYEIHVTTKDTHMLKDTCVKYQTFEH